MDNLEQKDLATLQVIQQEIDEEIHGTKQKWMKLSDEDDPFGLNIKRDPYRRAFAKIGRNEPCPCMSGKKFKRCHMGALT